MIIEQRLSRSDIGFVLACALAYAAVTLLIPPYNISLVESDISIYLDFVPSRPALYPAFLSLCKMLG